MKSFYEIAGEIKVPFKVIVECMNQDEAEEMADDITINMVQNISAINWIDANLIVDTVDFVNEKVGDLYSEDKKENE